MSCYYYLGYCHNIKYIYDNFLTLTLALCLIITKRKCCVKVFKYMFYVMYSAVTNKMCLFILRKLIFVVHPTDI